MDKIQKNKGPSLPCPWQQIFTPREATALTGFCVVVNAVLTGALLSLVTPTETLRPPRMCQIRAHLMLWSSYSVPGSLTHSLF